MLTSDLDSEEDKDKAALDALLTSLISELNMHTTVRISHSLDSNNPSLYLFQYFSGWAAKILLIMKWNF